MNRKTNSGVIALVMASSVLALNYIALPDSVTAQAFAPTPMRLAAKPVQTTVPLGTKGQFSITFLDRKYQPTTNDTKRRIDLRLDTTVSKGMELDLPPSVDALPGQKQVSVVFTPKRLGRVLIRIESKGLDAATVLFTVTPSKRAGLSLVASAWAQDGPRLEIVIPTTPSAPANGTTVIGFYVILDRSSPLQTALRIESSPPCVLLYSGENRRLANGSITIVIPPESQQSLEVQARTSAPGNVRISAGVMPQGPTVETTLNFVEPQPSYLAFEEMPLSIPLSGGGRLGIQVADQKNVFLRSFSGTWNVSAKASNNADAVRLEPDQFVLSSQIPVRDIFLRVVEQPQSEDLLLYASTQDGSLRAAEKRLGFAGSIGRLKVIAAAEVNRGASISVKAQFLLKDQEREASAEFPRTVQFFSNGGTFDREAVRVDKGAKSASSNFLAHDLGRAEIRVSTPGVDIETYPILIVVAFGQLVAIALGSGTIGGLTRFFYYRGQSWDLWPQKTVDGWHPGAVGNAAFSGVFGVVTLLMTRFGLIQPILESRLPTVSMSLHTNDGAFLLGIAGGFVGVAVLELLAKQLGLADALVFREKRKPTRSPRRPASGPRHNL